MLNAIVDASLRYKVLVLVAFAVVIGLGVQAFRQVGVIVFFLQIDTLPQKNSSRDKHLQNRLSETPCAFGAD